MGLESAPQNPLGRIDPSSIVSRASEVVTPSAVDALSDAVRKGFINAEDISARVQGAGARTEKTKLEELLAKEGQSAEAVQARSAGRQAESAESKSRAALAPPAQAAKEAEFKAAILDAQLKGSGVLARQQALSKIGWEVLIDPNQGMTQANQQEINRRFDASVKHTADKARAKDIVENAKAQELKTVGPGRKSLGGPSQAMMYQGKLIPAEKFKQITQYSHEAESRTIQSLDATGSTIPDIFGDAGQVQPVAAEPPTATAPPMAPVEVPAGMDRLPHAPAAATQEEAIARQQYLGQLLPDAVQPRSAYKPMVEISTEPTLGQPFGPLSMVTSIQDDQPVKMTAEQQKGLSQASFTKDQFKELETSFKSLSTNDAWLTGPVMGRLMSWTHPENWNADYASFDRAKTAILANLAKGIYHETGVLSDKDIERYQKAMPTVKDTPDAAKAKLIGVQKDIFSSIVRNIETMRGQGQEPSPIIQQMEQSARQSFQQLEAPAAGNLDATPAAARTPDKGWRPAFDHTTRGRMQMGPDGLYHK